MEEISIKAPVCIGERIIIPVVREPVSAWPGGGLVLMNPVALLIEECEAVFLYPLMTPSAFQILRYC